MSEISYRQEVEVLESMLEALSEGDHDYETAVVQSIDSTMPIYYTDIVSEWVEAGMPESDSEQGTIGNQGTIVNQMSHALWECYNSFGFSIISEATDSESALELVRQALGVRKGYADLAQAIIA